MSGAPSDSRTAGHNDMNDVSAAHGIAGVRGDVAGPEVVAGNIAQAQAHRPASQQAGDDDISVTLDGDVAGGAEAVLAAYRADGTAAFGKLTGSWAVAITDRRDGHTYLAVDPIGAGALYHAAVTAGSRAYASEPSALLAAPGLTAAPDEQAVRDYLRTGATDRGERTFFAGISRVPAGHLTTLRPADGAVEATTEAYEIAKTEPKDLDEALALLRDRKVGVRLGLGAPSAYLATRLPDAQVYVLTGGPTSTAPTSQATATALGRTPLPVQASGDQLGTDLADLVRILGEPVPDLAAYATLAVAKAADGVDVLVDPAGAEEALGIVVEQPKAKRTVDIATLLSTVDGEPVRPDNVAAALRVADRVGAHTGKRIHLPFVGKNIDGEQIAAKLTPRVRAAAGAVRPAGPVREWLLRLKNRVYGTFLSESFTLRPWFAQQEILVAFEDFIKGRNADAAIFWRLLNVELWMTAFIDPKPQEQPAPQVKGPLDANSGKELEIAVDGERWLRFPVRTELFARGDDYEQLISGYVKDFLAAVRADGTHLARFEQPWYLLVSEKIVAIAQGRSYFIWDIQPNWWARTLSKFVVKTPYGIGLGSPWTMQLALQEAGLPRILVASVAGAAGKVIGRRGLFYQVAGHSVRAIDGPTEYSAYPSNVSAKLAPAKPKQAAGALAEVLRAALREAGDEAVADQLAGVVIIDANDIGRNVLGSAADRPDVFFERLFADNPLGQGSEQTPLAVAVPAS